MNDAQRERWLGGTVGVFALAYIGHARGIEDSLLADAVGAAGVPLAAGVALALAAAALLLKSFLGTAAGAPAAPLATPRQWRLGAALAAVLVAYVLLLPLLGYIIAVSALVLTVALLAGARQRLPLALCAALSGVALWAVFEWALKIRMPLGRLFG